VSPMPLPHVPPALMIIGSLLGAAVMIAWRFRETSTPVSTRKIVAPPLGMSTGLAMFLAPAARVPWAWAAGAFLLGALVLAIPIARTSRLVRRGEVVLMERSKAFLWILLGVIAVRFGLRAYVEHLVSPAQSGGLVFLLAFGMILRWRVSMLLAYRRLCAEPVEAGPVTA
jgi:membrane protein CcdC involved in cytochrome C biogenesis